MPIPTLSVHPADMSPDNSPMRPFSRSITAENMSRSPTATTSTAPNNMSTTSHRFENDASTIYSRSSHDGNWASRFDVMLSSSPNDNTLRDTTTAAHLERLHCRRPSDVPLAMPIAAYTAAPTADRTSDENSCRAVSGDPGAASISELRRQLSEAEAALIENVSQWKFHWHEMAEVERLRRLVREGEKQLVLQKENSLSSAKSAGRNSSSNTAAAAVARRRSSSYTQARVPVVGCLPLNFASGFRRSVDRTFSNQRRPLENTVVSTPSPPPPPSPVPVSQYNDSDYCDITNDSLNVTFHHARRASWSSCDSSGRKRANAISESRPASPQVQPQTHHYQQ
ncbi:hypothetical protein BDF19DRAFT_447057 [Syncephalis fuscata]|nr:hypothetical protein BDF19DRAFT_447057 [Syncephalis fuscata]